MGEFFAVLSEIVHEIGVEIAHEPGRFIAEIVQFLVLVLIVWLVAFGFGKRRGFVTNMLTERADKVSTKLQRASVAEEGLAHAKHQAALKVRDANAEARRIVAEARQEAADLEQSSRADADAEAKRLTDRAQAALETERAEMLLEMRETLVDLVAESTRSIMNEKVPVAQQRKLIEDTIALGVGADEAAGGALRQVATAGTSGAQ